MLDLLVPASYGIMVDPNAYGAEVVGGLTQPTAKDIMANGGVSILTLFYDPTGTAGDPTIIDPDSTPDSGDETITYEHVETTDKTGI